MAHVTITQPCFVTVLLTVESIELGIHVDLVRISLRVSHPPTDIIQVSIFITANRQRKRLGNISNYNTNVQGAFADDIDPTFCMALIPQFLPYNMLCLVYMYFIHMRS
jgi:hypothetical protein